MTWNELKALVDKELEKQGNSGDVRIFFIDTRNYPDTLEVIVDEDGMTIQ